jgi:hypothetical protein
MTYDILIGNQLWKCVGCLVLALGGIFGCLLKFCYMDGQMGERCLLVY